MINQMLLGAIAMACLMVGLVMLRNWRTTRDRFFLFFALSFALSGLARVCLGMLPRASEHEPLIYLLRLASMILVVYAIVDKNMRSKSDDPGQSAR